MQGSKLATTWKKNCFARQVTNEIDDVLRACDTEVVPTEVVLKFEKSPSAITSE